MKSHWQFRVVTCIVVCIHFVECLFSTSIVEHAYSNQHGHSHIKVLFNNDLAHQLRFSDGINAFITPYAAADHKHFHAYMLGQSIERKVSHSFKQQNHIRGKHGRSRLGYLMTRELVFRFFDFSRASLRALPANLNVAGYAFVFAFLRKIAAVKLNV